MTFVIIIIHNVLPQGTLPLCQDVKLKCLCSAHRETMWPCPPVNDCRKEEINTCPPILPDKWPFYFTSSPPLLLCSRKETGIQIPVRWLLTWVFFLVCFCFCFWDTTLPSSLSASFLNKVVLLASIPHLSFYLPVLWRLEQAWTQCQDVQSYNHI